jgi:DNA invertase Pin-like site-specific DNA recombinase
MEAGYGQAALELAQRRSAFSSRPRTADERCDLSIAKPRSLQDLVGFLSEIHAAGVDLFLHQQGIDTTSPGGKAMFQMLGVFAEFERSIIQERVRAGLRRAKAEGKKLGRPRRIAPDLEERILAARKAPGRGEGVRKIAKRFGIDPGTVQRISRPSSRTQELDVLLTAKMPREPAESFVIAL